MTQNLSKPEPAPKPNGNPHLWSLVIRDMLDRNSAGVEKYGTPLQAGNGRDALMDAYQEALDLCVYLRQAIEERRAMLHVARHGEVTDDTFEPWEAAIPEQDVQRREQAATGSPIMDKIAEACGLKKADVKADFKGVSFELDAEPVEPGRIYRVPDRTSRATLPDECLGALCGRAGR